MQKVFLLLSILLLFGCAADKKEKKSDTHTENSIATEETISKPKLRDTLTHKIVTKNENTQDSIIPPKEDIIENPKTLEAVTNEKTPTKEEIVKPEIKKIRPDHAIWNQLTKKHVFTSGKVSYSGFKSDVSKIETYLLHLQKVPPQKGWTKNEKLAYWFNLYNASTIHLITKSYPIKSIKDINGGKPWDKKFIKSGSRTYSLNEIENTIVRPNFNEPRLHVAFNCAAISCPKLLKGAFIPSKLNSQLNLLSKSWINDNTKNKITESSIKISKIFDWYQADFKKGIIPFINQYANTKVTDSAGIQYLEYNWDLND